MSGIEIAGIALAMFPIVANGVCGLTEGARTYRIWRRCRIQLEDYASKMKSEKVYYLDTLEGLLGDIVQSQQDLDLLLLDPMGAAWRESVYERLLRQRLGRSYETFVEILDKMVNSLDIVAEKVGVSSSGKVSWDDRSAISREMKRLKIALLKDVHNETFEAIEQSNKKLRDITHQCVYLEPLRKSRTSRPSTVNLGNIRRHATNLHRTLITGKAWRCACRKHHMASLRLEPRSDILRRKDYSVVTSPLAFRVMLATSSTVSPYSVKAQCYDVEIRPSWHNGGEAVPTKTRTKAGRGVSFATVSEEKTAVADLANALDSSTLSATAIADMCSRLYRSPNSDKIIGFLEDEVEADYKHFLTRTDKTFACKPQSQTLADRLISSDQNSPSGTLSRKDRLDIAVTLASSVLQLAGTFWLKPHWSSEDIYFHVKNSSDPGLDVMHPYLPWRSCTSKHEAAVTTSIPIPGHHFIRSNVLFALGLTLIELCFGKTLRGMLKPEDKNQAEDEFAQHVSCAFRLLDSGWIWKEMGDTYEDVVRRCLRQPFDVRDLDLDNEDVQQQVYDTVVVPLNENLDNLLGLLRIK